MATVSNGMLCALSFRRESKADLCACSFRGGGRRLLRRLSPSMNWQAHSHEGLSAASSTQK